MEKENENKNVIVIQNDEKNEKNPNRLTFAKYGHFVAKYRYWIIGITLIFAIIGYLFSFLYLNPKNRELTSTFTLNIPLQTVKDENESSTNSSTEYTYFDGSKFSYQSIISNDSLSYIINNTFNDAEKKEKKYNFYLSKINEKNAISIEEFTTSKSATETEVVPLKYTITAKVKYLGNKTETAKNFINDLLNRAEEIALDKLSSSSFLKTLPDSIDNLSYDSLISSLSTQYTTMINGYKEIENNLSSNVKLEDNVSLKIRISNLDSKYKNGVTNNVFSNLKNENNTRSFYKYDINRNLDEVIDEVKIKAINDQNGLTDIQKQIEDKKIAISNYNRSDNNSILSKYFIQLNNELENLQEKEQEYQANIAKYGYSSDGNYVEGSILDNLNKAKNGTNQSWIDANSNFNNTLTTWYNSLKADAEQANKDYSYSYKFSSNGILFDTTGVGIVTGETNDWIITIAALLVGYLLSSIIFALAGNYLENNRNVNKDNGNKENLPVVLNEEPASIVIDSENKN